MKIKLIFLVIGIVIGASIAKLCLPRQIEDVYWKISEVKHFRTMTAVLLTGTKDKVVVYLNKDGYKNLLANTHSRSKEELLKKSLIGCTYRQALVCYLEGEPYGIKEYLGGWGNKDMFVPLHTSVIGHTPGAKDPVISFQGTRSMNKHGCLFLVQSPDEPGPRVEYKNGWIIHLKGFMHTASPKLQCGLHVARK